MDIVTLKKSAANRVKRRAASRRHTTEVSIEQLPGHAQGIGGHIRGNSSSSETLDVSLSQDTYGTLDRSSLVLSQQSLSSSWNSLVGSEVSDLDSDISPYAASQVDVFGELPLDQAPLESVPAHQYQLSYELALDNVLTPFAAAELPPSSLAFQSKRALSHVGHVIQELVSTEHGYVTDLSEIIEGYFVPIEARVGLLPLSNGDVAKLFGNLRDIRDFNKSLLVQLIRCGHDASKVACCFLDNAEGFKIYTQYCNNYPNSVTVLSRLYKDTGVSRVLKTYQRRLNHMLPLGAYLLKPVQRILKYHLFLKGLSKKSKGAIDVVESALEKMTEVAEHIDATKEKYDTAVHVQEVQSLIKGWEEGMDLSKFGDLVLESSMRCFTGTFRGRSERYLFLFQRLLLITKKDEDGYLYKAHVEIKHTQLTERMERDPNCFQVRQVSTGRFYTFQARSFQVKEQWVKAIKLLLMESIPHLPDKARHLILAGFPTDLGAMDRIPPHQRHRSEELPHGQMQIKGGSKTHRNWKSGQEKSYQKNRQQRSSTLPHIRVASPTHALVQATFSNLFQLPAEKEEDKREQLAEPPLESDQLIDSDSHQASRHDMSEDTLPGLKMMDERKLSSGSDSPKDTADVVTSDEKLQGDILPPVIATQASHWPSGTSDISQAEYIAGANEGNGFISGAENQKDAPKLIDINHTHVKGATMTGSTRSFSGEPETSPVERKDHHSDLMKGTEQCTGVSHQGHPFSTEDEDLFENLMEVEPLAAVTAHKVVSAMLPSTSSLSRPDAAALQLVLREHMESDSDEGTCEEELLQPPKDFALPLFSKDDTSESTPLVVRKKAALETRESPTLEPDTDLTPVASPVVTKHSLPVGNDIQEESSDEEILTIEPASLVSTTSSKVDTASFTDKTIFQEKVDERTPEEVQFLKPKSVAVARSHSFNSNYHGRTGTDNFSPVSTQTGSSYYSPGVRVKKHHSKNSPRKSGIRRYSSFHEDPSVVKKRISVVGLVSTTRNDHSLEDLRVLNPPSTATNCTTMSRSESSPLRVNDSVVRHSPSLLSHKSASLERAKQDTSSPRVLFRFQKSRKGNSAASLKVSSTPSSRANSASASSIASPGLNVHKPEPLSSIPDSLPHSVLPPYEGNPEESISFDEILASFDRYSTRTGETNKCRVPAKDVYDPVAPPSPEVKVKKSRKKRSHTVATIDQNTVREVRAQLNAQEQSQSPRMKTTGKVQKLAKDYSQRLSENQRRRMFKRHSIVQEDPESECSAATCDTHQTKPEPGWLTQLRGKGKGKAKGNKTDASSSLSDLALVTSQGEKSQSPEAIQSSAIPDDEGASAGPHSQTLPHVVISFGDTYQSDYDEEEDSPKGRFRGWVRTLVDKFSGKDK